MGILKNLSDWKIRNPGKIPNWSKRIAFKFLYSTHSFRALPDYCIIGAQKSGTTSLYNYLALHSQVKPSFVKEIHYYNEHYSEGLKWYRSHFPLGALCSRARSYVTGEASTMYFHDAETPVRMYHDLPSIKLLLVLRDPVDRAISHYHHRVRSGREALSLDDAMRTALRRATRGDFESGSETDYLGRGHYAKYLKHWLKTYPEDQFLVMKAESFFEDPAFEFKRVSSFLGIDYFEPETSRKFNAGTYVKEEHELRVSLQEYFKPLNRELYDMKMIDFRWCSSR